MVKDKFKEIVKNAIHPHLKNAGFKKSGNHFRKKLAEPQQVVTLQLSQGNSYNHLRFYFRCGILIDALKPETRDLKSEPYADFQFGLNIVSDEHDANSQFDITNETDVETIIRPLENVIQTGLIPFFKNQESENECIDYWASQDSLQGSFDLIKYLCKKGDSSKLEAYIIRLTRFIASIRKEYTDPDTARRRLDRTIALLSEQGGLTPELNEKIEQIWAHGTE